MLRRRVSLLCGLCVLACLGCESAQHKCDTARAAAEKAWTGYVQALEHAHAAALAAQSAAQAKLSSEVEHRLAPAAQKLADARYDRSSGAWLRAYQSAYHEACERDAECAALNQKNAEAKATIEDLSDRLVLARAARDAATGDSQAARTAAAAVIVHPEYPQLKQAQQLESAAYERCHDLKH